MLLFQALLLAHGGITTLGANVFSMAVVGPWVGYGAYRACLRLGLAFPVGVFFAALSLSDLSTYVVTSVQLGLAHPDPTGGVLGSVGEFLGIFALTQIPLAVAEGLLGVLVFRVLARIAPDELSSLGLKQALPGEATTTAVQERG